MKNTLLTILIIAGYATTSKPVTYNGSATLNNQTFTEPLNVNGRAHLTAVHGPSASINGELIGKTCNFQFMEVNGKADLKECTVNTLENNGKTTLEKSNLNNAKCNGKLDSTNSNIVGRALATSGNFQNSKINDLTISVAEQSTFNDSDIKVIRVRKRCQVTRINNGSIYTHFFIGNGNVVTIGNNSGNFGNNSGNSINSFDQCIEEKQVLTLNNTHVKKVIFEGRLGEVIAEGTSTVGKTEFEKK